MTKAKYKTFNQARKIISKAHLERKLDQAYKEVLTHERILWVGIKSSKEIEEIVEKQLLRWLNQPVGYWNLLTNNLSFCIIQSINKELENRAKEN